MEKEIQRTVIYDGKIMQVTREEVELEMVNMLIEKLFIIMVVSAF